MKFLFFSNFKLLEGIAYFIIQDVQLMLLDQTLTILECQSDSHILF